MPIAFNAVATCGRLGRALVIYLNQSKGLMPVAPKHASGAGGTNDYDAWYYRTSPMLPNGPYAIYDNLPNSPVGRILKLSTKNTKVLVCPTDRLTPLRKPPEYCYSYVFNRMFNGTSAPPAGIKKVTECRNSAEKVWVYEEDDAERDDGNGELWTTAWDKTDLLSIRHDERGKRLPDAANAAGLVNSKKRGKRAVCGWSRRFRRAQLRARQVAFGTESETCDRDGDRHLQLTREPKAK
jgi:hypothetical protein